MEEQKDKEVRSIYGRYSEHICDDCKAKISDYMLKHVAPKGKLYLLTHSRTLPIKMAKLLCAMCFKEVHKAMGGKYR